MVKVCVGLSGGVDSAVAAYLLQQQGYTVHGLIMQNWEDDNPEYCAYLDDLRDAEQVCDKLNIPLHRVNFAHEYWEQVFNDCLREHHCGRTPNPDILCNREIKFKAFLDYATKLGADYIATGHYAGKAIAADGSVQLLKASDSNKDQSYFLYTLGQPQLQRSLFPLHNIDKPTVRAIAARNGFSNHNKKDSTGICFIGERKFKLFLQQYIQPKPGKIEDENGQVLGSHDGIMFYTIGQRQGLNIGGKNGSMHQPWYVAHKDRSQNKLIVVQGSDHPLLHQSQLTATQCSWISGAAPALHTQFNCSAKTRYRQTDVACTVVCNDINTATVQFASPQRAITPGQSIVFYHDQVCLGGGIIL